MRFRVLGCHGGTSKSHQSVSFLVEERLAVDAGSLASGLTLEEQGKLETILITHSHLDHVNDLGSVCDIRAQQEGSTLTIAGLPETIDALRKHFFNNVLWPDFSRIEMEQGPVVEFRELEPEREVSFGDHRVLPVLVDHSVPSCGFLIGNGAYSLGYTGDTGPTERFWEVVNELPELRVLITEVSFPDRMTQLAVQTGHMTPSIFAEQMRKVQHRPEGGVFVYGLKPVFADEICREMAQLGDGEFEVLTGPSEFDV